MVTSSAPKVSVLDARSEVARPRPTRKLARPAVALLPPGAGLSSARSVIYLGGVNLTGPLSVLLGYAAGGALLMLACAARSARVGSARRAA
jgi:hypothetical protein